MLCTRRRTCNCHGYEDKRATGNGPVQYVPDLCCILFRTFQRNKDWLYSLELLVYSSPVCTMKPTTVSKTAQKGIQKSQGMRMSRHLVWWLLERPTNGRHSPQEQKVLRKCGHLQEQVIKIRHAPRPSNNARWLLSSSSVC